MHGVLRASLSTGAEKSE